MNTTIKTADEHAVAIVRLSGLMDADPSPGTAEANELERLAHRIESYEKKHHNLGLPASLTAISFRQEQ